MSAGAVRGKHVGRVTVRNPVRVFDEIGDEVTRRWSSAGTFDAFAGIATSVLQSSPVFETATLADVARWFLFADAVPEQKMQPFGQPPITVYRGQGFYIELLFWIDSPTAIHQHGFSGAFGVLHGSSYHSTYSFRKDEQIGERLRIGSLSFLGSEILKPGDVRTIAPGEQFIHALLHVESPSVSIVVRTSREPRYLPQYSYLAPGLAFDPDTKEEPLATRLALLRTLFTTDPELFAHSARAYVSERSLWEAYGVVRDTANLGMTSRVFSELMSALHDRHPQFARCVREGLRQRHREKIVTKRMRSVHDRDLRLFFSMLIHAPDRQSMYDLTRRAFPGEDPRAKILGWVDALGSTGNLDVGFERPSVLLDLALRSASFADVREKVAGRIPPGSVADEALRRDWYALHSSEFLAPLLKGPPEVREPATVA